MSDEPAKILLGDTAIGAGGEPPRDRRGIFRRKKKERPPLIHCENCGTTLTGHFCPQCGQPAVDYRRSFRHVIVDVLDSFLNWDSKFLATIGYLLTRPWRLTNEFLAGHRVRYLNPLRLYLLVSVLFFFLVNYGERQAENKGFEPIQYDSNEETVPGKAREPKPGATPPIDIPQKSDTDADETGDPGLQFGLNKNRTPTVFEAWLQQRIEEKIGKHGSKGKFFLRALMQNLPYMMLACVPLFAFILKILYFFRRLFYIDHLIYALHIHSFAYLSSLVITGVAIGLNRILPSVEPFVLAAMIITAVVQIFLSIRKVYGQGWIMSLFKFFVGGLVYLIVLCLSLAATVFVTLILP
jgi:ribosomal protein L32